MATGKRPYIVFATVRSGSYNLVSLLDSAPDLVCHGEIYKDNVVELPPETLKRLRLKRRDIGERDKRGIGFLQDLWSSEPDSSVGFKLLPRHLNDRPFLADLVLGGSPRIVILSRPTLEVCVSFATAKRTKEFTLRDPGKRSETTIALSEADLNDALAIARRFNTFAARIRAARGADAFDVSYAETSDPVRMQTLLEFLGSSADADRLNSEYHRQSRSRLHERVENWDWVVAYLNQTGQTDLLSEAGYDADGNPVE